MSKPLSKQDDATIAFACRLLVTEEAGGDLTPILTEALGTIEDPFEKGVYAGTLLITLLTTFIRALDSHPHKETFMQNFRTRAEFYELTKS